MYGNAQGRTCDPLSAQARAERLNRIHVESFCSGLCTERVACAALGIPIHGSVSEAWRVCREFAVQNCADMKVDHVFGSLSDHAGANPYCHIRARNVSGPTAEPETIDLLCGGTPCQPFTGFRHDPKGLGVPAHKDYSVTFGGDPTDLQNNVLHLAETLRPRAMLFEQVDGFLRAESALSTTSWMERLLDRIFRIVGTNGQQWFTAAKIFRMAPSVWVNISRPRHR